MPRDQVGRVDVAPATARRAVRQITSAGTESGDERSADRAADTVEDEHCAELIGPAVDAVIRGGRRAEFASPRELPRVTRERDDRRTRIGGELHDEAANTACG